MKKLLAIMLSFPFCMAFNQLTVTNRNLLQHESDEPQIIYESGYGADDHTTRGEQIDHFDETLVTIQFDDDFNCAHTVIENDEELACHRGELYDYFSQQNNSLLNEIQMDKYRRAVISNYAPFIQLEYHQYKDFCEEELTINQLNADHQIKKVYVREVNEDQDQATRNTKLAANYPFSDVLKDLGISSNRMYRGKGIKVGMIENGIPNSRVNLEGKTVYTYGTYQTEHSFCTTSVLGGNSGIANDVEFYCAGLVDYTFLECANWMIGEGVNIINRSNGASTGAYTSDSALADYLVKQSKVTFVNSAGNDGDENVICSPGTGLNVICVASTDVNQAVSYFSSAGYIYSLGLGGKPNIAAPGGQLSGIDHIGEPISGTSYSAPIVSGIIALLMEQYAELKYHPELVMSLITSTATSAEGQTNKIDHDVGAGIINYAAAIEHYSEHSLYTIPGGSAINIPVFTKNITLTPNQYVSIINFNLLNANNSTDLDYTWYKMVLVNSADNNTVATSSGTGNVDYLYYKNETGGTMILTIKVYISTIKKTDETEYSAIFYVLHHHSYTFRYLKYTDSLHKAFCDCGEFHYSAHELGPSYQVGLHTYANCIRCRQLVDLWDTPGLLPFPDNITVRYFEE